MLHLLFNSDYPNIITGTFNRSNQNVNYPPKNLAKIFVPFPSPVEIFSSFLFQYDCMGAPLNYGNVSFAWWTDRHEATHTFWSGSGRDKDEKENEGGLCECGLGEKKKCFRPDLGCNCDANNGSIWLRDEGT